MEEEEEGDRGIEKHVDVRFEVNVGVGVGKQDQHQEMEKRARRETTLRIAITSCDDGGGVGTNSVFESDASKAIIVPISPPPPPSSAPIPRRPSVHQKQKQKVNSWSSTPRRRGNSLGRDVVIPGSVNSRRHPHSHQNPSPRIKHCPFQLQPAYTAGISCGLPVSRPQPFISRSVLRPPLPPLPPFSAPLRGGEGAMVVSRPVSTTTTRTPSINRSLRVATAAPPPFSAPPVSESVVDEWGRRDGL